MACGPGTMPYRFDVANPAAIKWAEDRAAEMVTAIEMDTRAGIRAMIVDGFVSGVPPRQTAELIRATIGLTERDSRAVMNRQLDLMASGMDPADAARKAELYADKLLDRRALTIARTETMRASNEGQLQLWDQAKSTGALTGNEGKVWITAPDDRLCDICEPMDGVVVGLDEDFNVDGESIPGPPAHPNCRCTTGIVMKEQREAA